MTERGVSLRSDCDEECKQADKRLRDLAVQQQTKTGKLKRQLRRQLNKKHNRNNDAITK